LRSSSHQILATPVCLSICYVGDGRQMAVLVTRGQSNLAKAASDAGNVSTLLGQSVCSPWWCVGQFSLTSLGVSERGPASAGKAKAGMVRSFVDKRLGVKVKL